MATAQQAQAGQTLTIDDVGKIKNELNLAYLEGQKAGEKADPDLDAKAERFVEALISLDPKDAEAQAGAKASVETMAYEEQKKAAQQNALLAQPLKAMKQRSDDGGEVAKALIDLKLQVEELDPARFEFDAGWFSRMMGYFPFVGTPIKRYFTQYESAQTVIGAIIKSLEVGRDMLKRDNITLIEDQKRMRQMTHKLDRAIKLGQLIDQKLSYRLERDLAGDEERSRFIKEELLFVLRQRIMDLQQQQAVNQQGVLAAEIIIRNNKELIRGVNRALNVTVSALQVAVTVAMALNNQKLVLDKVNALSQTTDSLIAGTAKRLRTQGAAIHKQASSTQLNMDMLKQAFVDINAAMEDIADFRQKALPVMADSIIDMDRMTTEAEKTIKKMEDANRARPTVTIDLE